MLPVAITFPAIAAITSFVILLATGNTPEAPAFPSDTDSHLQHVCQLLCCLAGLDRGIPTIQLGTARNDTDMWPMLPHEILGLSVGMAGSSSYHRPGNASVERAWSHWAIELTRAKKNSFSGADTDAIDALLNLMTWSANVLMSPETHDVYRDKVVAALQHRRWADFSLKQGQARRQVLQGICRGFPD